MKFGNDLHQGDARILFNQFFEFKGTLPEKDQLRFPDAVCFTLSELREYLDKVSERFEERSIPENQRCIALMPGMYGDDAPKKHLRNKVTTVLVASKAESNENGQVTLVENCVLSEEDEIGDVSYNVGSLNP